MKCLDEERSKDILASKYWTGRQRASFIVQHSFTQRHYARSMRPTCLRLPDNNQPIHRDTNQDLVFFMPFLHWETDIARHQAHQIVQDVDFGVILSEDDIRDLPCDIDEKILRKYLKPPVMHTRRTLDQAYYYTLPDTQARDRDQVVFRATRDEHTQTVPSVLMVDQCWLWVIGDTVITSFASPWVEDFAERSECPDLLQDLIETLSEEDQYRNIQSPYHLASIIIAKCAATAFDFKSDSGVSSGRYNFPELFHQSIKRVVGFQVLLCHIY